MVPLFRRLLVARQNQATTRLLRALHHKIPRLFRSRHGRTPGIGIYYGATRPLRLLVPTNSRTLQPTSRRPTRLTTPSPLPRSLPLLFASHPLYMPPQVRSTWIAMPARTAMSTPRTALPTLSCTPPPFSCPLRSAISTPRIAISTRRIAMPIPRIVTSASKTDQDVFVFFSLQTTTILRRFWSRFSTRPSCIGCHRSPQAARHYSLTITRVVSPVRDD